MVTITTTSAPDSVPVGQTNTLDTSTQVLISVPDYRIPSEVFGNNLVTVPGHAELVSPLILSNKTNTLQTVTISIFRVSSNTSFSVGTNLFVPENDVLAVPLQGQFLTSGDELRASASANSAIDATISYTLGRSEQNDIS